MLIHIRPRLLTCSLSGSNCYLFDFNIAGLGLSLKGGEDLVTRRPYRNKRYVVACRKIGQKAIDGILIKTSKPVNSFTSVARWVVGSGQIVEHTVEYLVLDQEFDALSDNMTLWSARSPSGGGWSSRWPDVPDDWSPANAQPRMDLSPDSLRKGEVTDTTIDGVVVERKERFRMPTIEPARLSGYEQLPEGKAAFVVA